MINVSNTFQTNVDAGRTKLLLRMGNAIIDNSDILANGLRVTEVLGPDNDSYTIGNAPAGTISFDLLNEDGRFSNLNWGELRAVGYATSGSWTEEANATTGKVYARHSIDGIVNRTAEVMAVDGSRVYSLSDNAVKFEYLGNGQWGGCNISWAEWGNATWANMASIHNRVLSNSYSNAIIRAKLDRLKADGLCGRTYSLEDFKVESGKVKSLAYEACPIGVYDIERPSQTSGKSISCEGYGIMARLDNIEMDNYTGLFPISNRDLLTRICNDAGIGKSFTPAQNITIAENYWAGYTAREFVKCCAEADAANAMVDRNGSMVFRKPTATNKSFNESNYSAVTIAEYSAPAVTGVVIKNSDADVGVHSGTDSEVLTVLENPMLGALDENTKLTVASYILGEVDNVVAYHPLEADLWAGWQYEAGDIVTIVRSSVSYSIPIFGIEFTITSGCRASISVTGKEHRNDLMETNREQYVANFKRYEVSKTVDGLLSAVYDENGHSRIEQQAGLISACVTKSGGSASSFGWELTSSSWSLKANGSEVMKVDSSGMKLNGEITCTSLIVGGQTFTPASVQTAISQAYNNYGTWNGTSGTVSSSSGGWDNGAGFANNCWASWYSAKCVDATYLRMPYGSVTMVCTMTRVNIGGSYYYIPCVAD